MVRLLPALLALSLFATACGSATCRDVCKHAVLDCGWWGKGETRPRIDACVEACNDFRFSDDEKECLAEVRCSASHVERCIDDRGKRKRWLPGRD